MVYSNFDHLAVLGRLARKKCIESLTAAQGMMNQNLIFILYWLAGEAFL